jgi:hypothetical protein
MHAWISGGLAAVLCFCASDEAGAQAVRAPNGTLAYGFVYQDREDGPETEAHVGTAQGVVPLGQPLGAAVSVAYGGGDVDGDDLDLLAVAADLFWRDPERGYLGVGYSFAREVQEMDSFGFEYEIEGRTHRPTLQGGVFLGDFDVFAGGSYGFRKLEIGPGDLDADEQEYALGAGAGWYPLDSLRLTVGVTWAHVIDSDLAFLDVDSRELEGNLGVEWQLPLGERRLVRLGAGATYGNHWQDVSPKSRDQYSLSGGIAIDWPGAASLVEWNRQFTW